MRSMNFLGGVAIISIASLSLIGCSHTEISPTSTTESSTVNPISQEVSDSPSQSSVEQEPDTEPASEATVLSSGSFVDGEHPTQGIVRIIEQDNQRLLELDESFTTSTLGPDLVVVLHRSSDLIGTTTPPAFPINDGDYVFIAPLESYTGAQSYIIPDDITLTDYQSAAIWCRKFNATFGAATLKS